MGRKLNEQNYFTNNKNAAFNLDLQSKSWEAYFDEAKALYQMGAAGDVEAARQALELLDQLRKLVPDNCLVLGYYGSAYILKAREESNLVNKGKISHHGMMILDGALAKEPDNIELRILHAFVCMYLPDWLNRGIDAIADFQYLQSRYEADPAVFSEQFYQQSQQNIETIQKKLAAIPPHVQKIYDHFSDMAKKKQSR